MPNPLVTGWLRRCARVPACERWVLRGSLVMWATCPSARVPVDLDYLLPGTAATFHADEIAALVRAVAAQGDRDTTLDVQATEVIWGETESPGLRAHLRGRAVGCARPQAHALDQPPPAADDERALQLDLAVGDPMAVPPRELRVPDVERPVRGCALETLFGWKLHGLCEFGRGKWRAKDLFDLDLLWRCGGLDLEATRTAVALAFSSRNLPLSALDEFRLRAAWGTSRGGRQKWKRLQKTHAAVDGFEPTRDRVRSAVRELLDRPRR